MNLILMPALASAHVEQGQAAGFVIGLEHPWSGLDHILAMIAVGIWGAQPGNPAIWILPVTFPIMMSAGAMMGLLGIMATLFIVVSLASALVVSIRIQWMKMVFRVLGSWAVASGILMFGWYLKGIS